MTKPEEWTRLVIAKVSSLETPVSQLTGYPLVKRQLAHTGDLSLGEKRTANFRMADRYHGAFLLPQFLQWRKTVHIQED
jgi:hypothetical protein